MTVCDNNIGRSLLDKCDIYFGNALISKEMIIKQYLYFLSDEMTSEHRRVSFAIHTGSICFNVVSVVAAVLGCITYNISSCNDVFSDIEIDDIVMFNGQRYRWKGINSQYGQEYIVIEQDGKGRNGKTVFNLPFNTHKHLIKPYYGDSVKTDGRGIRKKKSNREEFLAYILGVDVTDVPVVFEASIAIIADKSSFTDICKQVYLCFDHGKRIGLLDIVSAAYYTSSGEEHQIGSNPTKEEPILKITSKVSVARDLVLDKQANKVIGLLVTNGLYLMDNESEVSDLIRRKSIIFVHMMTVNIPGISEKIIDQYEDAHIFACTKEYLLQENNDVKESNVHTVVLYHQLSNIINNTVNVISVTNGWSWYEYRKIRNMIYSIKQSSWQDAMKDEFIVTAYGLINLFNTAIFTMDDMERMVSSGKLDSTILSPTERLQNLFSIVKKSGSVQQLCMDVASSLNMMYNRLKNNNTKKSAILDYVSKHMGKRIAVIVPKAYYSSILKNVYPAISYIYKCDIVFTTPNRFNWQREYDGVLVVGNQTGKRFDVHTCVTSCDIDVLLYECEESIFYYRRNKKIQSDRKLNNRIGILKNDMVVTNVDELADFECSEDDIRKIVSVDNYIDKFRTIDIRLLPKIYSDNNSTNQLSEVKYIGTFASGEQIYFSKYYSAVTYDVNTGSVTEKTPEHLQEGDVLVFMKHDNYTRNVVDYIYEKFLKDGILNQESIFAYKKSVYWKDVLRKYKKAKSVQSKVLAKQLSFYGSPITVETVRNWLQADGHIIGPRKEESIYQIAQLTQDELLLYNPHEYFEACRLVRHDRREILNLISKVINDKLRGNVPDKDSVIAVVYNNIENLCETLELEYISELEETIKISTGLVNSPVFIKELTI